MQEPFFTILAKSFQPPQYKHLSNRTPGESTFFILKTTALFFFVMVLLAIPAMTEIPDMIMQEMQKIDATIDGKVSMSGPIILPHDKPLAIIDTTGEHTTIGTEHLLVTKETIYYRLLGNPRKINVEDVRTLDKKVWRNFVVIATIFIVPAALFWTGLAFFLKYFLTSLVLSLLIWVILDLTRFKQKFYKIYSGTSHALAIMIPIELIFLPVNTKWLFQAFTVFKVPFFVVPTVLYLILLVAGLFCIMKHHRHHANPL